MGDLPSHGQQSSPALRVDPWLMALSSHYVDDCIILGENKADVDSVILSLHEVTENFQLVDQGSIDKYLGLLI